MLAASSPPCVIYCRVSSKKQLLEGDGLRGQETRCREYAAQKGYRVLQVFHERGLTGGVLDRAAMDELLTFLGTQKGETIVIIEDLKRFARDVEIHFDLKFAIRRQGGRLESPLFRFEDTPEGKFIETIVAAQAELERNQNKRQVVSRMKARLEQGFWTFNAFPGYRYVHEPHFSKVLIFDEPRSTLIQEALEGFAGTRFSSPGEVVHFLAEQGFFGPDPALYKSKCWSQVNSILRCVLYTGYLEYKPWGITLRKAHHPALISLETYQRIQSKLMGRMTTHTRKDRRADFVLRNFVACQTCGRLLTGSWSKRRYAYYHCQEHTCPQYGKTIPREKLESAFEHLLCDLETTDAVLDAAKSLTLDAWEQKQQKADEQRQERRAEERRLETDLEKLADKLASTDNEIIGKALEKRIETLTYRLAHLQKGEGENDTKAKDFGTAFERVRHILKNPLLLWKSDDLDTKRLVVRLVFTDQLRYDRESGFGTTELSLPYLISRRIADGDSVLVDPSGEKWNAFAELILEWSELPELAFRLDMYQELALLFTGSSSMKLSRAFLHNSKVC